jgi:hypothetical protein
VTFLDIQQAVFRRAKLQDVPSIVDQTRIRQFINQRYRQVLTKPGLDQLRDTTLSFQTVPGQMKYGLPQALASVRDVYDLTNQRRILPRSVDWLRNTDPGLTAISSFCEHWIPIHGWGAELQELTKGGVPLFVASDSAADTTQHAFVETARVGGVRSMTAVAGGTLLAGTTRVPIGTLADHVKIVKFYLDTVPAGNVSLYDAATGGNLLSTITMGRMNARYYMLQLYPTPGASVTITVDGQRMIQDLVNPTEEPLIPEDFQMLLVHGAMYDEWRNRDDSRANDELAEFQVILADMRHKIMNTPDLIWVQRGDRGTSERISRLGGYFPPQTAFFFLAMKCALLAGWLWS